MQYPFFTQIVVIAWHWIASRIDETSLLVPKIQLQGIKKELHAFAYNELPIDILITLNRIVVDQFQISSCSRLVSIRGKLVYT
mgnify:CR=1 FL=1